MAARRAKVEELKEKQDEIKRNKRQYSEAQRQKLQAQLVRTFLKLMIVLRFASLKAVWDNRTCNFVNETYIFTVTAR